MAGGNPLLPPGGNQGLVAMAGPAMTADTSGGGGLQQLASGAQNASGGPGGAQLAGAGPDSAPVAPRPQGPAGEMMADHEHAKSVFEQVTRARVVLDHMRREMDNLVKKGDTVSPQDVIAAAGRVIGHGAAAKEMAVILSDMPTTGGQGLAAWLATHDAAITQQQAHVTAMQGIAQHRMGQTALKILASMHLGETARAATSRMGVLAPSGRVGITTGPGGGPPTAEAGQGTPMMALNNPLAPQGGGM